MAVLMSVAFALPVYYLCQMGGSFFVFWLAWLISLADGIGETALSQTCAYYLPCIMLPVVAPHPQHTLNRPCTVLLTAQLMLAGAESTEGVCVQLLRTGQPQCLPIWTLPTACC